ncbi:MAG: nucleoside-diphosphate kinase [Treponema sp.]|nr:nucleoside-diphosphate kinase [Treponema sp.]
MEQTLSYAIVTPYTIAKSRTGGVIARLLSRLDLELVAAQMVTPDDVFIKEYAASLRDHQRRGLSTAGELLADYVERTIGPTNGRPHRSLLLIFRGENPCRKLSEICGPIYPASGNVETISGETIRATYADYIVDPANPERVIYFEPAILTPRLQELADENLAIFSRHFRKLKNIVHSTSCPDPSKAEQTLVILKPDNWNYASSKPGSIIDMFSRTGLRIVGVKVFCFSLNQALDFYKPVEEALKKKLAPVFGQKAKEVLEREFEFHLDSEMAKTLGECFGREYANEQFRKILEFMSGRRPDTCPPEDADKPGNVKCMILVYEGENAIEKIRDVLGPTDPLKAPGGTVRREFGSNIMVNTAHASDSKESYEREKKIVRIDENPLISIIDEYLAKAAKK